MVTFPVELKLLPSKKLIPAALGAVREYAKLCFEDAKQAEKLALVTEEAIDNVLLHSVSAKMNQIIVKAGTEEQRFVLEVWDDGMPGDFEKTLQDGESLGMTLMRSFADSIEFLNCGTKGRCQRIVKHIAELPPEITAEQTEDESPIEGAVITIRETEDGDLWDVCRALYREYGLTYPNESVYDPESFAELIRRPNVHSIVAYTDQGLLAGHHAIVEDQNLPGLYEMGMAVVNSRIRHCGVFSRLIEANEAYYREHIHRGIAFSDATIFHPYTQQTRLKYGYSACGFNFNFNPPETLQGTFTKNRYYTSAAMAALVPDRSPKTVFLPKELAELAAKIYGNLELPRSYDFTGGVAEGETVAHSSYFAKQNIGRLVVEHIGADCREMLAQQLYNFRRNGTVSLKLYLPMEEPGLIGIYEEAKKYGFFISGILPNLEYGDLLQLCTTFGNVIHYETMVTIGPFTELLEMIRKFDPNDQIL